MRQKRTKPTPVVISVKATGPMLDLIIHCNTELDVTKTLNRLKKLVNPAKQKTVTYYQSRWIKKRSISYSSIPGKIEGKHTFEIIHKHPEHPLVQL